MTLNLKSLAFVPYVSLLSGICIDVLATLDHFHRRLIFRKNATCRPAAAGKNPQSIELSASACSRKEERARISARYTCPPSTDDVRRPKAARARQGGRGPLKVVCKNARTPPVAK